MDPEQREAEAVNFLDVFPWETGGLLIGGYAIAAYGPPRYSLDVDVVLPRGQVGATQAWLGQNGFLHRVTMGSPDRPQELLKLKVGKGAVTADLYFGGLRARESGAEVGYDWLAVGAREQILRLRNTSTKRPVRLVGPEALWVLKLIAGRSQDLSDLFSIRAESFDESVVAAQLAQLSRNARRSIEHRIDRKIQSEAEYHDALSRWALGSPDSPRNRKQWSRFRGRVTAILSAAKVA